MDDWMNWAGTANVRARRVHTPTSEAGIVEAVRTAVAEGRRIRARGSGHSFSGIGIADEHAINLTKWKGVSHVDLPQRLVTVRSGTTIGELTAALDALGLAMVNLGDIDAQTVSGAIATGTHGTGARLGGLATQVAALELVLADGSVRTCSSTQYPDLFDAARVGLGTLGVLTSVTLQCVDAFVLDARESPARLADVVADLDEHVDGTDHFEFYWLPHTDRVLTKHNNRTPAGTAPAPLGRMRQYLEYDLVENRLLDVVCRIGRALPSTVRPVQRAVGAALSPRHYRDVSHRVFVTRRDVRFVESEYAVPREAVVDVLSEVRAAVGRLRDPVAIPIEVRFAAADDIWLSTAYQRDTAYVAVHQYRGMPYQEYFAAFEAIAGDAGGRPHWGKMHSADAGQLRERYPRFDDFRAVRAAVDTDGVFGNRYTDTVLDGD